MRKKFLNLILFFILIFLITLIVIFGIFIYQEFFTDSSEPVIYKVDKIFAEEPDMEKNSNYDNTLVSIAESIRTTPTPSNIESINNKNSSSGFFYSQLNKNQKIIYDGLMKNKQYLKQGNYVINYKDSFTDTLSEENGSDKLGDDYQSAIEAFTYDNIDVFYLDLNKMFLNIETSTKFFKTTYNVYISAANDSNYLSKEFQTTEKIEKAISELEAEKENIISHLNGTDYQNILYIHDYLVNNVEYDSTYQSIGSYNIYGALVEKKCVCEGYSKAFKYLLNSAGYDCELMQGTATNSSGQSENHMWNCVKLNDKWYAIDVTWDDPIIIGGNGRTTNEYKYRYYLKGTQTFDKDHFLEYQLSENGKTFSYPNINREDY